MYCLIKTESFIPMVNTADIVDSSTRKLPSTIWVKNTPKCQSCKVSFQINFKQWQQLKRPHHCRICGGCFCSTCCPKTQEIRINAWVSSTKGHKKKYDDNGVDKRCCNNCAREYNKRTSAATVVQARMRGIMSRKKQVTSTIRLQNGTVVEMYDLQNQFFNRRRGIITDFNNKRYVVQVVGEERKKRFKPQNIKEVL